MPISRQAIRNKGGSGYFTPGKMPEAIRGYRYPGWNRDHFPAPAAMTGTAMTPATYCHRGCHPGQGRHNGYIYAQPDGAQFRRCCPFPVPNVR